jgi:hypothetical protein
MNTHVGSYSMQTLPQTRVESPDYKNSSAMGSFVPRKLSAGRKLKPMVASSSLNPIKHKSIGVGSNTPFGMSMDPYLS